MNNTTFAQAQLAYDEENFAEALRIYNSVAADQSFSLEPGEYGLIFHKIGNCQIKLGKYAEAVNAYNSAISDADYSARGTAFYNLGMAYALMSDFTNAVKNFQVAVKDTGYPNKYKAYTAMGNAYLKSGKVPEAGAAFRRAALDDANPEPTRALLNLGVCFMAMGRPDDAVKVYESAFQFHMSPSVSNRLYANLGQAYVSCGQMKKAVDAFEKALADKSYVLSDSASVDYQRAIASVSKGNEELDMAKKQAEAAKAAGMTVGIGAVAGAVASQEPESANADVASDADMAGFDDVEDADEGTVANPNEMKSSLDETSPSDLAADDAFEKWTNSAKEAAYNPKKKISKLRITLIILFAIFAVLFAACVVLFTQGFGFPTQEMIAQKYFANPISAKTEVFAPSVTDQKKDCYVGMVSTDANPTINGVDRSMLESTVYVTSKSKTGADIQYKIKMSRDILGWKIQSVDLAFASQE